MRRALLSLEGLTGTLHAPAEAQDVRLGVLLLNAGPAPRAGNSDLSARLGDHLAALGLFCFRVDFPGLGDSPGALPERTAAFWREVQQGRHDAPALALGRRLRREFGLRGLVAGGLCAGALGALRAADLDPEIFAGLMLLEPSFRPEPEPRAPAPRARRLLRRGLLRLSRGRILRPLRPLLFRCLALEGGHSLPPEIDPDLAACWRRTLRRRLPTFLAMAQHGDHEHACRRILAEVPSYRRRSLTELLVEGSNHLFIWGEGRDAVIRGAGRWAARLKTAMAIGS